MIQRNPWNLSPGECRALDALIAHVCDKGAGAALGLSPSTISAHADRARLRMNARNRLDLLLKWDRFRRGQGQGAA